MKGVSGYINNTRFFSLHMGTIVDCHNITSLVEIILLVTLRINLRAITIS